MKDEVFYEQASVATTVIAEIFRARLLKALLGQGIITHELIDMLMTWNHNSGFNVHTKGRISGFDVGAQINSTPYAQIKGTFFIFLKHYPDTSQLIQKQQDNVT